MSFYLSKKKQIYYFRIRIPKDLIPYFPIPEIKKSLKTRDPSSAKLLHSHLSNKVQKTFSILRADTLSDEEINLLVCSLIQTERKTPSQSSVSTKAPKLSNIIKLFVSDREPHWSERTNKEFTSILEVNIGLYLISAC